MAICRLKLFPHAAESNADNIAVMKLRSRIFLTHLEPQFMHQIDIFRSQAWWMRPQVHER